jgi:hypothetical protein
MAITTYAELQSAVSNWLARSYDSARVQEFIALGEAELNRRLRIREMETSADLTLVSGTRTVALPTGYLEMIRLYLDGTPVRALEYFPPIDYWVRYMATQTSKPKAYTIEGENITFGPTPDSGYTGKILYYAGLDVLSDSNTTNAWLTKFPDMLLAASLRAAWLFKGDDMEQVLKWTAELDRCLAQAEKQNKRDRVSGAPLVIRTDTGNPPAVRA